MPSAGIVFNTTKRLEGKTAIISGATGGIGEATAKLLGSIIVMASVAGMVGFVGGGSYIASKPAVYGLAKCAALELGPFKIRVNAIAPGPIDNRMMRSLEKQIAPEAPSQFQESLNAQIPLHRYGTNEEVAQMAAFLASAESSYTTGGIFTVDGGYTAG